MHFFHLQIKDKPPTLSRQRIVLIFAGYSVQQEPLKSTTWASPQTKIVDQINRRWGGVVTDFHLLNKKPNEVQGGLQ